MHGRIAPRSSLSLLLLLGALLGACGGTTSTAEPQGPQGQAAEEPPAQEQPAEASRRAAAQIAATEGNEVGGTVYFEERDGVMEVRAYLTGLQPFSAHGFHVHEVGDCSAPDGSSAGGHFNPGAHPHGLPNAEQRHAGDLGNITANADGRAQLEESYAGLTLEGAEDGVVGRAVIVHESPDDGSQPTGAAGGRIGCGVIQLETP